MTITPALIKELRESTGAGMMDCKKALGETSGNIEEAIDWLRKKGLSKASKKADRVTAEGVVSVEVSSDGTKAVLLEVNSETDFVARNDMFQSFVKKLTTLALNFNGDLDAFKASEFEAGKTVEEVITNLIATIGENISIRRMEKVQGTEISAYVHNAIVAGMGKIGVLVALDKAPKNEGLGKQIAMHIASNKPESLDITSLDEQIVEKEKNLQREIAKQSGKPDDIIEKMLVGRISKFYQEVCLVEQPFVMDPDKSVKKVLEENGANISEFKFFILGEGIEKGVTDFAQEVANTIK